MDDGYVIPGLNEDWTFFGAKLSEWIAGFGMFIMGSLLFEKVSRGMPILMLMWLGTTIIMATVRKKFPDEEKGVANAVATAFGIKPPNIPAPASIQPLWSGAPLKELEPEREFVTLKLDEIFDAPEEFPE